MVANAIIQTPTLAVVETSPDYVRKQIEKIRILQKTIQEVLVKDVDYGKIQGCGDKPTLFKSGAEKVMITFSLQSSYDIIQSSENFDGKGFFSYTVKCYLWANGIKLHEGLGHCNSKETKFRYKWVTESKLPTDVDADTLISRVKNGQYGDYLEYRIEEDSNSKANTILKMAKKRALVDAVLTVANLSELFTQDFDDLKDIETPQDKVEELKEQLKSKQKQETIEYKCAECGKKIQKAAAEHSEKKYGRPLCFNCGNKESKKV
jgi:DNA-directed RNA polymerase subunit RPC12/RpoP